MAKIQKPIEYIYIDDLSGEEVSADDLTTIAFSIDGKALEIDLSAENAAKLTSILEPYVKAGRRQAGSASSASRRSTAVRGQKRDLEAIRTWAKKNNHSVADRGRISYSVMTAYDDAH
jgi:hypothetical protein